jgi:anaerobic sulfite reductase subunit B
MSAHLTVPHRARIAAIAPESADTCTFTLALDPAVAALDAAAPGQFVMLSVFGHGEAAFTPSALPGAGAAPGTVVLTVRRVGGLTGALFGLPAGAMVGVRGPFGHGISEDPGRPTVYVAGGCGLSPLRAAIARQVARRPAGTRLAVVYGARDVPARIHRADLAGWDGAPEVLVIQSVERAAPGWRGRTGNVLGHVAEAVRRTGACRAVVCGPPAMLAPVAERLCGLGLDPAHVHVALERYMKCGTGHCGHCYVGDRYVCTDGPVFPYAALRALPDAFPRADHPVDGATP